MMENGKTVLLVIDVQQALVDSGPWEKARLLAVIRQLLGDFREHGRPVLYVRHDDGPGTDLALGTPGWEVAREVAPREDEKIFDKRYNSAFLHTGLEEYLREQGVERLVITGLQTEYCVDATVKSAFERGFRVVLPEGGISTFAGGGLTAEQINELFYRHIWQGRYGDVAAAEKIIKEINS